MKLGMALAPMLVLFGWWLWPEGAFTLPFSAYSLEVVSLMVLSVLCFLGAVVLFFLPELLTARYAAIWSRAYRTMQRR